MQVYGCWCSLFLWLPLCQYMFNSCRSDACKYQTQSHSVLFLLHAAPSRVQCRMSKGRQQRALSGLPVPGNLVVLELCARGKLYVAPSCPGQAVSSFTQLFVNFKHLQTISNIINPLATLALVALACRPTEQSCQQSTSQGSGEYIVDFQRAQGMKMAQAELPKLLLSSGPLKDLVVWHGFAIVMQGK